MILNIKLSPRLSEYYKNHFWLQHWAVISSISFHLNKIKPEETFKVYKRKEKNTVPMKPMSVVSWVVTLTEAYVTTCMQWEPGGRGWLFFRCFCSVNSLGIGSSQASALSSSVFETTADSPSSTIHSSCQADDRCIGGMTFYETANTASTPSSCRTVNNGGRSDVLALSRLIMAEHYCGKMVTIENQGVSVNGMVVDKCMGCDKDSIDVSRHLFDKLADARQGSIYGVN